MRVEPKTQRKRPPTGSAHRSPSLAVVLTRPRIGPDEAPTVAKCQELPWGPAWLNRMAATSVSARPSTTSVGTLPSGMTARNSGLRVSFRANDNGFASNGAPTSCKAMCAAIELDPRAKESEHRRPVKTWTIQGYPRNRQNLSAQPAPVCPSTRPTPAGTVRSPQSPARARGRVRHFLQHAAAAISRL